MYLACDLTVLRWSENIQVNVFLLTPMKQMNMDYADCLYCFRGNQPHAYIENVFNCTYRAIHVLFSSLIKAKFYFCFYCSWDSNIIFEIVVTFPLSIGLVQIWAGKLLQKNATVFSTCKMNGNCAQQRTLCYKFQDCYAFYPLSPFKNSTCLLGHIWTSLLDLPTSTI